MIAMVAILALSFSTKAMSAVNAYLYFTDSSGKTTKVTIQRDGSFTTPTLHAGTYRWSFGATQSGAKVSGSGEELPKESVQLSFGRIMVTYNIVSPKDPASGLPTGKRMHKPMLITKELDKSSPKLITNLGTVVLDANGETLSGTVAGMTKDGNKTSMDSWDAK